MIGTLLPAPVESSEAFDDLAGRAGAFALFPEEEALIARAVAKRRNEFTTVRACARTALGRLGIAPAPIVPGQRGAPQWPSGVVGSMTHCAGYRAAAVARSSEVTAIGLDAEPNAPLPEGGVRDLVTRPEEHGWLARLQAERPEVSWDRLVFSAKESVYKAWFPLTRLWLDFQDAVIEVDAGQRTFSARILTPEPLRTATGGRLSGFEGRWAVADGLIVTAIAVPAAG
ncbi:4'-phosphopantetheinyl transferase superfamily protein [Streptomyces sp. SCA3-4]|uniref:4'-phosphopantetheinyl transferase family protein n=1 Tax=Streptomyces sichuanensis TaxID=2871810 RepID=UPI001CE3167D|nr:4'-phosphopantetheinyl transferase superfamily protein [Streptomyces sichuanensis]MCA6094699.1 4'-phosphopantetheinyl transferase superfamily protein [Streptomyces sichuanensis]